MTTSTASPFINALRTKDALTENGMTTNSTSLNACTDLFFILWAMRGQDTDRLQRHVSSAWNEDRQTALRTLFWGRDVRGWAGERQVFKDSLTYLIAHDKNGVIKKNIQHIPEYGRRDDLMVFMNTPYEKDVLELIKQWLEDKNALCAKWMDRQWNNFHKVRKYMNIPSSTYRKLLVELSKTVEQKMASWEWSQIEYGKLPSLASARYQKAFLKNDADRYTTYKEWLQNGTEKINASAVYPYDVIKSLKFGDTVVAEAQWMALPNYLKESNRRILPMCDVSESMEDEDNKIGWNDNLYPMDVCISLWLYISERNVWPFQNAFITFTDVPTLQYVTWSLSERLEQMKWNKWYNTDLKLAFTTLLNRAKEENIAPEDMPTDILILSDMEFDDSHIDWINPTAQEMIKHEYENAWYTMPNIIYWNLQSRDDNMPVKFDEQWTALVSGFSPAIIQALLVWDDMTPVGIMNKQVNSERYEKIVA